MKTVEYHLGHVFAKLGVAHRSQLHAALAARPAGEAGVDPKPSKA